MSVWCGLVECVVGGSLDQLWACNSTTRSKGVFFLVWALWTSESMHGDFTVSLLFSGRDGVCEGVGSWFKLTPPPLTDPERSGHLLQLLSHLTRTLCYALLFPPPPSDLTPPPSVPVERILTVLTQGLKPPPAGHTVEARVLQDAIPIVHTAMWNCLCVLIRTCHAHLLPYGNDVMSLMVRAITFKTLHQ